MPTTTPEATPTPAQGTGTTATSARIGAWIKLPSPMSVEAVFAAGADFVCIDMCNGWLSIERVCDLLAYAPSGRIRLVRLPADAPSAMVGLLLDAGADGIVVPHIDSIEQARRAVQAAFFAPFGTRGMGSSGRAGTWGLGQSSSYLASGHLDGNPPFVSVMVESLGALNCLEDLASIPGLSQLLVGTADLSLELGGEPEKVEEAVETVLAACRRSGISAGIATGRPEQARQYVLKGFDALYVSNDLTLLARGAQQCFEASRPTAVISDPHT